MCIYKTTFSLSVHMRTGTWVVFTSWLLWILLLWRRVQLSLRDSDLDSFRYIPRIRIAGSILQFCFSVFENSPYCFPYWLNQFTFYPQDTRVPFFSTALPILAISCLLEDGHSRRCEVIPYHDFDLHLPAEHLFMYLLAIVCLPWKNVYSDTLPVF